MTPLEFSDMIAGGLDCDGVQYVKFVNCGHGVVGDKPREALKALRDFVNAFATRGAGPKSPLTTWRKRSFATVTQTYGFWRGKPCRCLKTRPCKALSDPNGKPHAACLFF